jgi:hypothetical protein
MSADPSPRTVTVAVDRDLLERPLWSAGRVLRIRIRELGYDYAVAVPASHCVTTSAGRFTTASAPSKQSPPLSPANLAAAARRLNPQIACTPEWTQSMSVRTVFDLSVFSLVICVLAVRST